MISRVSHIPMSCPSFEIGNRSIENDKNRRNLADFGKFCLRMPNKTLRCCAQTEECATPSKIRHVSGSQTISKSSRLERCLPGKARRRRWSCSESCVRGLAFGICFRCGVGFRSLTGTPSRHPLLRKIIELLRSMLWTIATICSPDT